jgi:hypothetical protein
MAGIWCPIGCPSGDRSLAVEHDEMHRHAGPRRLAHQLNRDHGEAAPDDRDLRCLGLATPASGMSAWPDRADDFLE